MYRNLLEKYLKSLFSTSYTFSLRVKECEFWLEMEGGKKELDIVNLALSPLESGICPHYKFYRHNFSGGSLWFSSSVCNWVNQLHSLMQFKQALSCKLAFLVNSSDAFVFFCWTPVF